MDKCERCGAEVTEEDSFIDEDTHALLCNDCYYNDTNRHEELEF